MKDITPVESIVPVFQLEIDEKQRKMDQETWLALQAEKQAKVDARVSALRKLAALGLDESEIQALLG